MDYASELMVPEQYGFRKGMSNEHAIHSVTQDVHIYFNNGKYSTSIFMDIQMSFDSLHSYILLNRMTLCGITGTELEWFKSFLNDRRQYVKYKDCKSSANYILHGVPQGSIPSHVFFLLYVLIVLSVCYTPMKQTYLSSRIRSMACTC